MVLTFEYVYHIKLYCVTKMLSSSTFHEALFILLYKVALSFESL